MSDRVLIVRPDNDGDVLLAGPAIRAVAARAGHVTLLCGPRGRQAAALLPGVDEVLVRHVPWIDAEPRAVEREDMLRLVDLLASRRFDAAIVLTSFHQSPLPTALLLRMAGVPFTGAVSEDFPGSLLDVRHRVPDDLHEVERGLSTVAACGYAALPGDRPALRVERPERGTTPPPFAEPYVVVHPGASVPARAWPAERHAALVDALAGSGLNVAVTGGPAERGLTARAAGPERPRVRDLGGHTSLAGLAEVLAGAQAVIVGNTGPAHLAAAVGTPVVSLFAPTVPARRWRPWMVPCELLALPVPCAGCRARSCPVPGHPCMEDLGVEAVLEALGRLMRRPAGAAQEALAA